MMFVMLYFHNGVFITIVYNTRIDDWISWSSSSLYIYTNRFLFAILHFECFSTLKIGNIFYQFYTYVKI